MATTNGTFFFRALQDPLVHFIVLGALIYGAYGLTSDPVEEAGVDEKTVIVSTGEVEWLSNSWEKRWNRAPTETELDGLIRQHIRETVLYREALAMGLDEGDVVIRRRLGQKLEFLSQDLLQPAVPEEKVLRAYYEANTETYLPPASISMAHVFFNPETRGDATLDDAEALKIELAAQEELPSDVTTLGDSSLLENYYDGYTQRELSRILGGNFASAVFELEEGSWHGPVLSNYGTHLVFVHKITSPPLPSFDEVKDRIVSDWTEEERIRLNDRFIAALQERYTIIIETPTTDDVTREEEASQ